MKPFYQLCLVALMLSAHAEPLLAEAAESQFQEGSQYQRIDPPVPIESQQGKVEIVEMFFYACPHCYELEPKLQQWLKDKPYVDFRRIPAIIGPSWVNQARAFYMIQALPESDKLHEAFFKAIHDDGKQIYNEYSVMEFFAGQGIDRQKALGLYRSPEVAASVNDARLKTVKYGLRGVPAVIINGEFVTAPYFVRNQEEMIEVLDNLVVQARAKSVTAANTEN